MCPSHSFSLGRLYTPTLTVHSLDFSHFPLHAEKPWNTLPSCVCLIHTLALSRV